MIPKITRLTDIQVLTNRQNEKGGISATGEMNGRRVVSIDPAMAQKGGKIKVGRHDGFLYTLFKICFFVILSPILIPIWLLSALVGSGSYHDNFFVPSFRARRRVHLPPVIPAYNPPPTYAAPHPHRPIIGRGVVGGGRVGLNHGTLSTNRVRVY